MSYAILSILILNFVFNILILYVIYKKFTYLSTRDKKIINFVIDIYIDYGKEIDVIDEENHDKIIADLKELKTRIENGKIF